MKTSSSKTEHANMVIIAGCGLLLRGPSGVGKTEISLQCMQRGHQFLADDLTTLTVKNERLYGQAPAIPLQAAVRDIGLVRIAPHGKHPPDQPHRLHAVISLGLERRASFTDPSLAHRQYCRLLHCELPQWHLTITAGRSIPSLLELIVWHFLMPR